MRAAHRSTKSVTLAMWGRLGSCSVAAYIYIEGNQKGNKIFNKDKSKQSNKQTNIQTKSDSIDIAEEERKWTKNKNWDFLASHFKLFLMKDEQDSCRLNNSQIFLFCCCCFIYNWFSVCEYVCECACKTASSK